MPMIVDPGATPPPLPVEVVSPDGYLRALVDATNGGVLLVADRSEDDMPPSRWQVSRTDGDTTVPVRSGDPVWAPGGSGIAYDHEAPLGTSIAYTATPVYDVAPTSYDDATTDTPWDNYFSDTTGATTDWSDWPPATAGPREVLLEVPLADVPNVTAAGVRIPFAEQPEGTRLYLSAVITPLGGTAAGIRTRWIEGGATSLATLDEPGPPANTPTQVSRTFRVPDGRTSDEVWLYLFDQMTAGQIRIADVRVLAATYPETPATDPSTVAVEIPAPTPPYDVWIKSLERPDQSMRVHVHEWPTLTYVPRRELATLPGARFPVVQSDAWLAPTSTMTVYVDGSDDLATLTELITSDGVLLVQTVPDVARPDWYFVAGSFVPSILNANGPATGYLVEIEVQPVERPDSYGQFIRIPDWTSADLAENFSTWAFVTASYPTTLELATDGDA